MGINMKKIVIALIFAAFAIADTYAGTVEGTNSCHSCARRCRYADGTSDSCSTTGVNCGLNAGDDCYKGIKHGVTVLTGAK